MSDDQQREIDALREQLAERYRFEAHQAQSWQAEVDDGQRVMRDCLDWATAALLYRREDVYEDLQKIATRLREGLDSR